MSRVGAAKKPLTKAAERYLDQVQERWSGSLPLSMLSTPLRTCAVSGKKAPVDLMLRMKCVELHPDSVQGASRFVMLPTILHPHFVPPKKGKGFSISLNPAVLEMLQQRKTYKTLDPKATMAPDFGTLVHQQLGQRVLQEFELLLSHPKNESLCIHFETQEETEEYLGEQESKQKEPASFILSLKPLENLPDPGSGNAPPPYMFSPRFVDEEQTRALAYNLTDAAVHMIYDQSPITRPLGVALYRLNLWTRSLPHR